MTQMVENDDSMFYSWQCISLVIRNHTVDFVIKDELDMMSFIHVILHCMGGGPDPVTPSHKRDKTQKSLEADKCLTPYKWMKFRMKLSYCAWLRNMPINELVLKAIGATLTELRTLAVYKL